MTQDPGWRPALSRGLIGSIPLVGILVRNRASRGAADGLTGLRIVFTSIIGAQVILVVLLLLIVEGGGDAGRFPWLLLTYGVVSLAVIGYARRRPLRTSSNGSLVGSYRATMFLGMGLAEASTLLGIAGAFITDERWIAVLGLVFGFAGMALIAPTRGDIERRQEALTAAGSPLSLRDALMGLPPENAAG
jgi:hypothetical protein